MIASYIHNIIDKRESLVEYIIRGETLFDLNTLKDKGYSFKRENISILRNGCFDHVVLLNKEIDEFHIREIEAGGYKVFKRV